MARKEIKDPIFSQIKAGPLPQHIAVIMDGNGRWAQARGLLRMAGHRAGVEAIEEILSCIKELGIGYLTIYAFSTENWKRPETEVSGLMRLLIEFLDKKIDELNAKGVRICAIGDIDGLDTKVKEKLRFAERQTAQNTDVVLNMALNYGGRQEIVRAVKGIALACQNGDLDPDDIDATCFSSFLYTAGQPDPDLLIRTSGEFRISNFLLWQIAYSEIWITDTYWPDFRKKDLLEAIVSFQGRDRRFGGLSKHTTT